MTSAGLEGIGLVLRLGLAGVLLMAGGLKMADRPGFRTALDGYGLLPRRANDAATIAVPAVELILGGLLLAGAFVSATSFITAALLMLFAGWLAVALLSGKAIDCGCFSRSSPRRLSWRLVIRNLVLVCAAILVGLVAPLFSLDEVAIAPARHDSYSAVLPSFILVSMAAALVTIAVSSAWLVRE